MWEDKEEESTTIQSKPSHCPTTRVTYPQFFSVQETSPKIRSALIVNYCASELAVGFLEVKVLVVVREIAEKMWRQNTAVHSLLYPGFKEKKSTRMRTLRTVRTCIFGCIYSPRSNEYSPYTACKASHLSLTTPQQTCTIVS